PGSYPLLDIRPRVCPAAHHADVFRGRSPDPAVSDRRHDQGSGRDRRPDGGARHERDDADGQSGLQVRYRAARPALDFLRKQAAGKLIMVQPLNRLKESASQTAGPYVHIGLTPNFAEIGGVYDSDLGTTMVN